jgi:methylisocitrate lyase
MSELSPGARFRSAMLAERPLQVAGVINAYSALLAERAGFRSLYISGAGVANASYGLPDLALTTLTDVLVDVNRIAYVTSLPLLVDVDTGWGPAPMIARTIKEIERAGAAAVQIEDQVSEKRCGHRPGKAIVSSEEMVDRITSAVAARNDPHFCIVARTDALAIEGMGKTLDRACKYARAGADLIFVEACTELEQYRRFKKVAAVPILANLTEFGKTPLFTLSELDEVGVDVALYPLSAFRAMSDAAEKVYSTIREKGTQSGLLKRMQSRDALYEVLNYHSYERQIDDLLDK